MPVKDSAEDKRRIGQLLKEARQAAKLSQAEVAKAMSSKEEVYHQTQIAKIERGARSISLAEAIAYMDAVQGDLNHLVSLLDNPDSAKLNAIVNNLASLFFELAGISTKLNEKETIRLVVNLGKADGVTQEEVLHFVDILLKAQFEFKLHLQQSEDLFNKYIDVLSVISKEDFQAARHNLKILKHLVDDANDQPEDG